MNWIGKFFWFVTISIGMSASFYRVLETLSLYFQYPVVVNLLFSTNEILQFPAVTFCNLNRVDNVYIECLLQNETLMDCINKGTDLPELPEFPIRIPESKTIAYMKAQNSILGSEAVDFITKYAALDFDSKYMLSSPTSTVFHSLNGEMDYDEESFLETFNYRYGTCYTYNSTKTRRTINSRFTFAEILINIMVANYYLPISPSGGLKVLIHDFSDSANIEDEGFDISPGYKTEVITKKTIIKRLPYPYENKCMDYKETSEGQCKRMCIQEHSLHNCGCIDPTITEKNTTNPMCNLGNPQDISCLDNVLQSIASDILFCNCNLPCLSVYYENIVSKVPWPSKKYFSNSDLRYSYSNLTELKRNVAILKIIFDSSYVKVLEENPKFMSYEILSNLGGDLGMFLGLSLLSAFRAIEISFDLLKKIMNCLLKY